MYGSLRVITPPATEPVAIDLARQHCRVDSTYDDALLAMYVTSARQRAEAYLNRALLTQQLQYAVTSAQQPIGTPPLVFPLNWPLLSPGPIELPRAPAQSVEQIMWGPHDDMRLADPEDYSLNLGVEPAYISVRPGVLPNAAQRSMVIDFTAGYDDADASTVPAPIRHAILVGTAFYYEQRGDTDAEMPAAFFRLLDPYRLWTFSG